MLVIKRLIVLSSVLFSISCSTYTSLKRVDYVTERKATSAPKSTVFLCRPSGFHMFATSFGVTINDSAVGDLGSGELMEISLPKSNLVTLTILIPDQNPITQLIGKQRKFSMRLTSNPDANYVIFSTTPIDTQIDGLGNMTRGTGEYTASSTTSLVLQEVNPQVFARVCPIKNISYFSHKDL